MNAGENYYDYSGLDLEALSAPMSDAVWRFVTGAILLGITEIVDAIAALALSPTAPFPPALLASLIVPSLAVWLVVWLAMVSARETPRGPHSGHGRSGRVLSS